MNPILFFSGQLAAAGASSRAFGVQGVNEARLALANTVGPDTSPAQLVGIQSLDKALELKGQHDQIMYEVATTMQDSADRARKQAVARREQAIQNGYLF